MCPPCVPLPWREKRDNLFLAGGMKIPRRWAFRGWVVNISTGQGRPNVYSRAGAGGNPWAASMRRRFL